MDEEQPSGNAVNKVIIIIIIIIIINRRYMRRLYTQHRKLYKDPLDFG